MAGEREDADKCVPAILIGAVEGRTDALRGQANSAREMSFLWRSLRQPDASQGDGKKVADIPRRLQAIERPASRLDFSLCPVSLHTHTLLRRMLFSQETIERLSLMIGWPQINYTRPHLFTHKLQPFRKIISE